MPQRSTPARDRLGRQVAGWSCLVGGAVLWAMAILAPPWLDTGRLEYQRHRTRDRLHQERRQLQAYQSLEHALQRDDPFVLEHVAYHQLGLKPAGATLLERPAAPTVANVENWLSSSVPLPGQSPPPAENSLMARLTTTAWTRLALMGIGIGCIGFGLTQVSDQ